MDLPARQPALAPSARRLDSEAAWSGLLQRIPHVVFVPTAALLVCALLLYFFCPRFYLWRGVALGIPELYGFPETNRAVQVLQQLQNPWAPLELNLNKAIAWRLLFPVVGHMLRLHPLVFLALPFVGCWAAAALILHVMTGVLQDRLQAIMATITACGAAWFYVSTGWLTYNDSWVILGLVAVACLPSRLAVVAACLSAPWIDERFLLVLPTALAMRMFILPQQSSVRGFALDVLVATAACLPYLAVRLTAYVSGADRGTADYLDGQMAVSYPFAIYPWGAVAGLRCNWIFIVAWGWLAARSGPRWQAAVAVAGAAPFFAVTLGSAGDVHRSAGVFIVMSLAGVVMLARHRAGWNAALLPIAAVLTLVLPAAHVFGVVTIPICGVFDEWYTAYHPTIPELTPDYYNAKGLKLAETQQTNAALVMFDRALRVDPKSGAARLNKALIHVTAGRHDEAIAELDLALQANSGWPEAYFWRGHCRARKLDPEAAIRDLEQALACASEGWPRRTEAEDECRRLRRIIGDLNR